MCSEYYGHSKADRDYACDEEEEPHHKDLVLLHPCDTVLQLIDLRTVLCTVRATFHRPHAPGAKMYAMLKNGSFWKAYS